MNAETVFVLGGGGHLGAHEVGLLRALIERNIVPDAIIGTSIGAVNGALFAAAPTTESVHELTRLWTSIEAARVFDASIVDRALTLARTKTHLVENDTFRQLLADALPAERIEDLAVRFECVAACIETAAARYFTTGPLVDAVLASSAVPGLLPPVEIDGAHFLDGGLVASIPLDRALRLNATTIYVLQVGRIEEPLSAPTRPWEVAMIAFEISRRHRFAEALAAVPDGVEVHVLPTGEPKQFSDLSQYRFRADQVEERIDRSYEAASRYLEERS